MKRTGKFYSKNEKETLTKLGLVPAPQSGAGWIIKEDGENENVMVQLKSTDSQSYRIDMLDIKKLEYHAEVSHKIPIFLIQFLKQDKIYALIEVNNLEDANSVLKEKEQKRNKYFVDTFLEEPVQNKKIIKSSKKAKEKFYKERGEKYGKRK